MKQHKWHKEIHAYADGAEIEFKYEDSVWNSIISPNWDDPLAKFRIKPTPQEPKYLYAWLNKDIEEVVWFCDKPSGILEDDMHKYIGKIKLEAENGND